MPIHTQSHNWDCISNVCGDVHIELFQIHHYCLLTHTHTNTHMHTCIQLEHISILMHAHLDPYTCTHATHIPPFQPSSSSLSTLPSSHHPQHTNDQVHHRVQSSWSSLSREGGHVDFCTLDPARCREEHEQDLQQTDPQQTPLQAVQRHTQEVGAVWGVGWV